MEAVFTFHNAGEAIGGERRLLEGGVKVKVMPLPASLGAGCGLCLRVAPGDLDASLGLLRAADISPQGLYLRGVEGGQTVYTPL
ncbi:MAG: DUF3343 domain-containing protein [Candidatus Adiutrix sp.]|jgi:hypothetical protein|nr:DUF3343 domain-containing protein [Candidatus Adiutrix sp.]